MAKCWINHKSGRLEMLNQYESGRLEILNQYESGRLESKLNRSKSMNISGKLRIIGNFCQVYGNFTIFIVHSESMLS